MTSSARAEVSASRWRFRWLCCPLVKGQRSFGVESEDGERGMSENSVEDLKRRGSLAAGGR